MKILFYSFFGLLCGLVFMGCSDQAPRNIGVGPSLGVPQTPLTITEASQLIGGHAARGKLGDVLLSNSKIRVIIQKPGKEAGIGSFGGTIIDADHVRPSESAAGSPVGNDQWGEFFPLVNVEWTVNYYNYEVINDGKDGGPQVLRAYGMIDVYDFLDLDWIADAASAALGQQLRFADQFDDLRDPFNIHKELSDLSYEVITDYTLAPGSNYVKVDTTFTNPSKHPISFPVGDFLVGDGELQFLVPGLGFAPQPVTQAGSPTPAVIYAAFPGQDVSYGYFYEPAAFKNEEGAIQMTTSMSYSGMTGVLLGEEFLKILPVGMNASPEIHFSIPPKSERTITRYFVVGSGSAGSVWDTGMKILKIPSTKISGKVVLSNGASLHGATVAIKKLGGATIITYVTDALGKFGGLLSTGESPLAKLFGEGKYEVWVDKPGFHESETKRAGSCSPAQVDMTKGNSVEILCTLGAVGRVAIVGGVTDEARGVTVPARLTILGEDPSPETSGSGTFSDTNIFQRPFGIVDVHLINAKGGLGLSDKKSFDLEPGPYRFVISHGPEYSIIEREVTVEPGKTVSLENLVLKRIVETPGFVSADFHIHALPSPDSVFSVERRALAAVADGLDILQSSDHDFLTDYGPVVSKLVEKGILRSNSVQTVVGDEITPNHYGHIQAFPLVPNVERPDHGALDWSAHPLDQISPSPDFCLSPRDIVEAVLQDPGEEVIQINHISDGPTGLPVATGWLTTPIYQEKFGVKAFTSYADPVERRIESPLNRAPMPPYGMDESELIFENFTAVELTIGPHLHNNELWESSLPTWFNLLNLGLLPTATGDSDSHHEISVPLGMPRNFVASAIDPRDGTGSFAEIDEEAYASSINNRKVIVSAGPFVLIKAKNEQGIEAGVGEMLEGKKIELEVLVEAPSWAWFDTIEIYANTEPIPAEDTAQDALVDEAATPDKFAAPYHVPHYIYEPTQKFRLVDQTLKDWKEEDGKIQAKVSLTLHVDQDTWIVAMARGTKETPGYRSLFPVVPDVLHASGSKPKKFDPNQMESFHQDPAVTAPAWGFTNPIFIDVDGDTDGDGFAFEAIWVKEGLSTLKPFKQ